MHGKIIVLYFLMLAILVGALKALGINAGMQGILIAMAIAGVLMLVGWLIVRAIRRKAADYGLTLRQWTAVAFGHSPDAVNQVVVDSQTSGLVPYEYEGNVDEEDEQDLPARIIEPGGLPLAETFQPQARHIVGETVSIFGLRRSGKSNGLSVIIEGLAPYEIPMLICDTKNEYAGLVNPAFMPNCVMAGAAGGWENQPDDVKRHYIIVDAAHAKAFGRALMDGSMQIVLNLQSYETDDLAARVMCGIIQGIHEWESARPNAERIPIEVVLDEAHKWLPQQVAESHNLFTKETQALLQNTFFTTVARMGGSNGFGLIVAAQRISELDKRLLQSTWQFLFRQTEDIDIKRYEVKGLLREEVLSLRQGECFVFCPLALGFKVFMNAKRSPDLSRTPGLAQLEKHKRLARAKHTMLAHNRSYVGQDDVVTSTLSGGQVMEEVTTPSSVLTPDQKAVLEQWHKGLRTHREIAAVLQKPGNAVYNIMIQLDAAGYIERNKKATVV